MQMRFRSLLNLMQTCKRQRMDAALQDESTKSVIQTLKDFQNTVYSACFRKIVSFWILLVDDVKFVFMLPHRHRM